MTDKLLEPTDEERAYHLGWQHYQQDLGVNMNPYSKDDEATLYDEFERGWSNAQLSDSVEE